jgi:hypothetical protein
MFRDHFGLNVCFLFLFACASVSHAEKNVRTPLGVYAKVDIETAISAYIGPADGLHAHLQRLYANILDNPAIAGIAAGERWDRIQLPNEVDPGYHYDWSYLDDVFLEAHAAHKSVQLILTPGVDAPAALLAGIAPCDVLFSTGAAPRDCGTMDFVGFLQEKRADGKVFPLPWNEVYENAWGDFLVLVNDRYKDEHSFVSIAVAGPTGASDEIILPTSANDKKKQPSGKQVDEIWEELIYHSFPNREDYQFTDQVFIDSWKKAIDLYEGIFSGVTLVLGPDGGHDLPDFNNNMPVHPGKLFAVDCSKAPDYVMSCDTKTKILDYFADVAGANAKSTQLGGLRASSSRETGDIGIAGVKLLSSDNPSILGGAEFDHPVSTDTQGEGCPKAGTCPGLTVVDAAYHVLTVYFDKTTVAENYGGERGSESIQYLEVPYLDVQYANEHPCAKDGSFGYLSMQDLLNQASHDLFAMAHQKIPLPPTAACKAF